jgi:N-acetylmuramoyl-L-alanine amidase
MKNVKPGHIQPIVCLDAGHYGKYNQSPAISTYYESDMVWKLHLKLKAYLEEYGIQVIQTRSNQATDKALYDRGAYSKDSDLFISLHSNAVGSDVNNSVDYPVVYVQLDGKGNDLGNKIAKAIEKTMETKQSGRINTRKGNRGEYYGVLRGAAAVGTIGLIIEHSFHTNTKSTTWLLSDSNLDKMAKVEADIIAEYFDVNMPQQSTPSNVIYRVQSGAYSVKKNADEQLAKIKSAGFDAFMVKADGMYKIQVGAYSVKANAEAQMAKIKKAGFSAFITTKGGKAVSTKKSILEVAKEVILGKWGNGTTRKQKLKAAGYDPNEVQKKVNELL